MTHFACRPVWRLSTCVALVLVLLFGDADAQKNLRSNAPSQLQTRMVGTWDLPENVVSVAGRAVPVRLNIRLSSTNASEMSWSVDVMNTLLFTAAEVSDNNWKVNIGRMTQQLVTPPVAQVETNMRNFLGDVSSVSLDEASSRMVMSTTKGKAITFQRASEEESVAASEVRLKDENEVFDDKQPMHSYGDVEQWESVDVVMGFSILKGKVATPVEVIGEWEAEADTVAVDNRSIPVQLYIAAAQQANPDELRTTVSVLNKLQFKFLHREGNWSSVSVGSTRMLVSPPIAEVEKKLRSFFAQVINLLIDKDGFLEVVAANGETLFFNKVEDVKQLELSAEEANEVDLEVHPDAPPSYDYGRKDWASVPVQMKFH